MALWKFHTYVSAHGHEEVGTWYAGQTAAVRAAFDQRLRNLAQMQPQQWRDPYCKQLEGEGDGLVEIRFKADRVQHRPLGFYGPGRMEFTVLLIAREIGDRFDPKDACETALARKDEILRTPNLHSRVIAVE